MSDPVAPATGVIISHPVAAMIREYVAQRQAREAAEDPCLQETAPVTSEPAADTADIPASDAPVPPVTEPVAAATTEVSTQTVPEETISKASEETQKEPSKPCLTTMVSVATQTEDLEATPLLKEKR